MNDESFVMDDKTLIANIDERIARSIKLDNQAAYFYQQYLATKARISELQEKAEIQLFNAKEASLAALKELDSFGVLDEETMAQLHSENEVTAKDEARMS